MTSDSVKKQYMRYAGIASLYVDNIVFDSKHVSISVKGKKMIAIGWNESRNTYNGDVNLVTTHSEMRCCIQTRKITEKKCNIYIYRIGNNGELKNSIPCNLCMCFIRSNKMKNIIVYDGKEIIKINPRKTKTTHFTKCTKNFSDFIDIDKAITDSCR